MTKDFQESFNNFNLRDIKTTAFWDTLDGNLQGSFQTLGLTKQVSIPSDTVVGPSTLDNTRDYLYFVKYNQNPLTYISVARFDLKRKRFLSEIVLNAQETIDSLQLSPDGSVLFLLSASGNKIRRINLDTLAEIQNPILLGKPKKILFHSSRNLAWIAGDSLYRTELSQLTNSTTPTIFNYALPEVVDTQITSSYKYLSLISKLVFGSIVTYQFHSIDLLEDTLVTTDLYSGPSNLPTTLNPSQLEVQGDIGYILVNSLQSPQIIKFDIAGNTFISASIPGGISQNILKDLVVDSSAVYISQGTEDPNTGSDNNNLIYKYNLDLSIPPTNSTIILPQGAVGSYLVKTENELYAFPIQANSDSFLEGYRINLADNSVLQKLSLLVKSGTFSRPSKNKDFIFFTNTASSLSNLLLFNLTSLPVDFGQGTKVLVLDGQTESNCTLDGVILEGGPFNDSNPYIFTEEEFESIQLANGATATYSASLQGLILKCSKSILIDNTSKLIADGLGDFGGQKGGTNELAEITISAQRGQGLGGGNPGASVSPIGSYGGLGGTGAGHSSPGQFVFSSQGGLAFGEKLIELLEPGSGGGGGAPKTGLPFSIGGQGGNGGGSVALVSPSIQIDGIVSAKGLDGSNGINYGGGGGAGSGGSVHIITLNLAGSGTIDTSGGQGGLSLAANSSLSLNPVVGGSGSFGKIRIDALNNTSSFQNNIGDLFSATPIYAPFSQGISKVIDTQEISPVQYLPLQYSNLNAKFSCRETEVLSSANLTFSEIAFTQDSSQLILFKNGIYQISGTDYTETSNTSVTFAHFTSGDIVTGYSLKDSDTYFDHTLDFGLVDFSITQEGLSLSLIPTQPLSLYPQNFLLFKNGELVSSEDFTWLTNDKILIESSSLSDSFKGLVFNSSRFQVINYPIVSNTSTLQLDYLPNAQRILIFKNGLLINPDSYQELDGAIKLDFQLIPSDKVVIVELLLTNGSFQFAQSNQDSGSFLFNKKSVDELNQRYMVWKVNLNPSKTLSPIITDINIQVEDSLDKPFLSLDIKKQAIEIGENFNLSWSSFNVTSLNLQGIDLETGEIVLNTSLSNSFGTTQFTYDSNIKFQLTGLAGSQVISYELVGYVNTDGVTPQPTIEYQEITYDGSSSVISFSNSYAPGSDNLLVFQDGRLLTGNGVDYTEISPTSIELTSSNTYASTITAWIFPVKSIERLTQQILSPEIIVTFNKNIENSAVYVSGTIKGKGIEYSVSDNILTFTQPISGIVTVINSTSKAQVVSITKHITNTDQKDIVTNPLYFDLGVNGVQVYKNGSLSSSTIYIEKESYALRLIDTPTRGDRYDFVAFQFIEDNIINEPSAPLLTQELTTSINREFTSGFIRQDFDVPAFITKDFILGREDQIPTSLGQTIFTLHSIGYTIGDGTLLVFLNGQLLIPGNDYTELASGGPNVAQIQLTNPVTLKDTIGFISIDPSIQREEFFTPTAGTTDLSISLTYNSGELLVFRDGLLDSEPHGDFSESSPNTISVFPNFQSNEVVKVFAIPQLYIEEFSLSTNTVSTSSAFNFSSYSGKIPVFRNGQLQTLGTDYRIVTSTSIQFFTEAWSVGDLVQVCSPASLIPNTNPGNLTLSKFSLTDKSKSLLFQNGLLLTQDQDYQLTSNTQFDLISPLANPSNTQVLTYHNLDRIDVAASDFTNSAYIPTFSDNSYLSTIAVFRNGQLLNQDTDYILNDGTYDFSILTLDSSDNFSFVKFNTGLFVNQIITLPSVTLNITEPFRAGEAELLIFRNGILLDSINDYIESEAHSVTLQFTPDPDDIFNILVIRNVTQKTEKTIQLLSGNQSTITIASNIDPLSENVLVFKNELLLSNLDYTETLNQIIISSLAIGDKVSILKLNPEIIATKDLYVSTGGETEVSFKTFSFSPIQQKLFLFKNGALQTSGTDYIETDALSISFSSPLSSNDVIVLLLVSPSGLQFGYETQVVNSSTSVIKLETLNDNGSELLVFSNQSLLNKDQDYVVTTNFELSFIAPISSGVRLGFIKPLSGSQEFITGVTSQDVTFSSISYIPGNNQLLVFKNSLFQEFGSDYVETSSTSIQFSSSLNSTDKVTILKTGKTEQARFTLDSADLIIENTQFSSNQFIIFKNGLILYPGIDYIQISLTKIQLTSNPSIGDTIDFIDCLDQSILLSATFNEEDELNVSSGLDHFSLTNFEYILGNKSLLIFQGGKLLSDTVDYTEIDSSRVNLTSPTQSGDNYRLFGLFTSKELSLPEIKIQNFDYEVGQDELIVFLDGLLQYKDLNYEEIDSQTIDFDLSAKELIFLNGILQTAGADYSKKTIRNFTFDQPLQIGDFLEIAYVKAADKIQGSFTITDSNQLSYFLDNSYNPGTHDLVVFKNGILQEVGLDYTESSSLTIDFITDIEEGDLIRYIFIGRIGSFSYQQLLPNSGQNSVPLVSAINQDRALVFRNGILQKANFDYSVTPANLILNISTFDNETITILQLSNSDFARDSQVISTSSSDLESTVEIAFASNNILSLSSQIGLYKVNKSNIQRSDIVLNAGSRVLDTTISTDAQNIVIFKNGKNLRPNRDFAVVNSFALLNQPAIISDKIAMIQFLGDYSLQYDEVIGHGGETLIRFNNPYRTNTYDYWVFYNGTLLFKDSDYQEIDQRDIKLNKIILSDGDIVSLYSFGPSTSIALTAASTANDISVGETIFSDDADQIFNVAQGLSKGYGLRLTEPTGSIEVGHPILSREILNQKNLIKHIDARENIGSDFTLLDNKLFQTQPVLGGSVNSLRDIVNRTLQAPPNPLDFTYLPVEGANPELTNPGLNANSITAFTDTPTILFREEQVSSANQTDVIFNTFTYTLGAGELLIFVNGTLQLLGLDYTEVTGGPLGQAKISFINPLPQNEQITGIKLDSSFFTKETQNNLTSGTNIVTFSTLTYSPGTNELHFFRNGLLQILGTDYTETSSSQVSVTPNFVNQENITGLVTSQLLFQQFFISSSQTSVSSDSFDFSLQSSKALVFRNGQLQILGSDYEILSPKAIGPLKGWSDGDNIVILGDKTVKKIYITFGSYFDSDDSEIEGLNSRLANPLTQSSISREVQRAQVSQTNFTLKTFQFTPGSSQLLVFKDGFLQRAGFHYQEQGINQIIFTNNVLLSSLIDFTLLETPSLLLRDHFSITSIASTLSIQVPFTPNSNQLLVFKNGLLLLKDIDYTENYFQLSFAQPLQVSDSIDIIYLEDTVLFQSQIITNIQSDTILLNNLINPCGLQLQVYRNGFLLTPGVHYLELSSGQIKFVPGAITPGDNVALIYLDLGDNVVYSIGAPRDVKLGSSLDIATKIESTSNSVRLSFVGDNLIINPGDSVTLSWDTINATTVTIDQGIGSVSQSGSIIINPTETTVYTITAINSEETIERSLLITVVEPPSGGFTATLFTLAQASPPQVSIFASPNSVQAGSPVTLNYTAQNVATLEIDNGVGFVDIPSGSIDTYPSSSIIYTITATDIYGQVARAAVPVTVVQGPVAEFSSDHLTIERGQSALISWQVYNSVTTAIDQGIGLVSHFGSQLVNPTATITYTLTASDGANSTSKALTITVIDPPTIEVVPEPVINSFTTDKEEVIIGDEITLSWLTSHSLSAFISPDIGPISLNGSAKVQITNKETIFVLAVGNSEGKTATQSIVIKALSNPKVDYFRLSDDLIEANNPVILEWSTRNTDKVVILGIGEVPKIGQKKITTSTDKTYILTAYNDSGTDTQKVKLTILPKINVFLTDKAVVKVGDQVHLIWQVLGADSVEITSLGSTSISGSRKITITESQIIHIKAKNSNGTVEAQIPITAIQ